MYNYTVVQISPLSVLKAAFCTGVCLGGALGILLGLLERDVVGLFGGVFLGFVFGLLFAIFGLGCAAIFNALAPKIGGIAVSLQPTNPSEVKPEQTEPRMPAV